MGSQSPAGYKVNKNDSICSKGNLQIKPFKGRSKIYYVQRPPKEGLEKQLAEAATDDDLNIFANLPKPSLTKLKVRRDLEGCILKRSLVGDETDFESSFSRE